MDDPKIIVADKFQELFSKWFKIKRVKYRNINSIDTEVDHIALYASVVKPLFMLQITDDDCKIMTPTNPDGSSCESVLGGIFGDYWIEPYNFGTVQMGDPDFFDKVVLSALSATRLMRGFYDRNPMFPRSGEPDVEERGR